MFENKVTNLAQKTQGTLIIKEYPTASAHSGHFKSLLNELALKKSFRPDIIFVDYLNICASSRYRGNSTVNSYSYIKAIAEELRGLAVEANVPIVSATQTTRSGYGSSDVELTDTSESFGLPATADLMFALISTDELEGLGQIMVKQLKNRYNDPTILNDLLLVLIVQRCVCMIANRQHKRISLTAERMRSILMKNKNQKSPLRDSNSHERLLFCI